MLVSSSRHCCSGSRCASRLKQTFSSNHLLAPYAPAPACAAPSTPSRLPAPGLVLPAGAPAAAAATEALLCRMGATPARSSTWGQGRTAGQQPVGLRQGVHTGPALPGLTCEYLGDAGVARSWRGKCSGHGTWDLKAAHPERHGRRRLHAPAAPRATAASPACPGGPDGAV